MINLFTFMTSLAAAIYSIVGILLHFGLGKKYPRVNHTPVVSILIAARNEEKYLPKLSESIINQTVLPHIWIILDDNSTDRTSIIIKELEQNCSNVCLKN